MSATTREDPGGRVQVYADTDGEVRWRLLGANGERVIPPEGHRDATDALRAMRRAAVLLASALEHGRIEVLPPPGSTT